METVKEEKLEHIPTIEERGSNVYNPSDIKRWGVERFLDAVSPKEPFLLEFPEFTDEENRKMDELLAEGDRGAI